MAFVLVDAATIALVPTAQAMAGVRVMAAGIGDSDPFPQATCATATRAVMPLAPVHPTITGLPSGDALIGWTRRSRAGWAWRDGLDAPLGEEREAYSVAWAGGSADVLAPAFTYTAAMRAADIAAGRTASVFAIRQIGDAALSPPVLVTLIL